MKTKYKRDIKFEDIMFWIVIAGLIGISLWMFSGSPTEIGAIIGIGTFAAASDILLWKAIFNMDKKTEISFMKLKNEIDSRFNKIDDKLNILIKNDNINIR